VRARRTFASDGRKEYSQKACFDPPRGTGKLSRKTRVRVGVRKRGGGERGHGKRSVTWSLTLGWVASMISANLCPNFIVARTAHSVRRGVDVS